MHISSRVSTTANLRFLLFCEILWQKSRSIVVFPTPGEEKRSIDPTKFNISIFLYRYKPASLIKLGNLKFTDVIFAIPVISLLSIIAFPQIPARIPFPTLIYPCLIVFICA